METGPAMRYLLERGLLHVAPAGGGHERRHPFAPVVTAAFILKYVPRNEDALQETNQ